MLRLAAQLLRAANNVVWGPFLLVLLLGSGIYFTLRSGFFQVTHFGRILHATIGSLFAPRPHRKGAGISPFQAVSTALAGTMGVGNITGVATALSLGGAGAIFWMWISALLGMMTKFAEVTLAVKYRGTDAHGQHYGGPMLYLSRGLGAPGLAWLFCLLCVPASFGIGNMAQANAVSGALSASFSVPPWLSGAAAALVVGLVIVGGLRRIAAVAALTVPLMSALYLVLALFVILCNATAVPAALAEIFRGALHPRGAVAGGVGFTVAQAMRYGFARGVFSNEAGLGSAPIAHAAADTDSPMQQGMWGMFEVFADTLICCTLTALVLLTTGVTSSALEGGALTSAAFSTVLGDFGGSFVAVSLVFFAVASMLGWCYYGEASLAYLTGGSALATTIYRWIFVLLIPIGAVARLETVWNLSDLFNGLMAIPNLLGILGLSRVVLSLLQKERL